MRWLPELVTRGVACRLPLSDAAAGGLVAALVFEGTARRERLAEVLRHDPPLALWALCRAAENQARELRTTSLLAEWLAERPVAEFAFDTSATEAPSDEAADQWADVVGFSRGVAALAAERAAHAGLDAERTYLLGLVHALPRMFETRTHASKSEISRDAQALNLQPWLIHDLMAVAAGHSDRATSPAECVAWAVRASKRKATAAENLGAFTFDPAAQAARIAESSRRWRQSCPAAESLVDVVHKLARLEVLERDCERTLNAEKLESLKELAYGAGHEINNPLANISARAQTLLQEERDPQRRRMLSAINTQAFRAYEMIADMMLFARPPQPKLESVDLASVVRAVYDELAPQAGEQQSQWVLRVPESGLATSALVVQADKTQVAVALRALCVNALEALGTGGRVEIAIGQPATLAETVQITVSDTGPGIADDVRPHIFDPFYSGREAGRGLGFGLSKCWRIVTLHGGSVEVESSAGAGARFTIVLPRGSAR